MIYKAGSLSVILLVYLFLGIMISIPGLYAAVGCTLNDPDKDIKRFFPDATGYKTEFISVAERGGNKLVNEIEGKLGDSLDPVYESMDVPYAYYTVLKGKEIIGRVHGVNQKGKFGGLQLILATDTNGVIKGFYYQRILSPEPDSFKSEEFTSQFVELDLSDFYTYRISSGDESDHSKIGQIKDPSRGSSEDFKATLRGIMKNLILLDIFMLDRMHDKKTPKEEKNEK